MTEILADYFPLVRIYRIKRNLYESSVSNVLAPNPPAEQIRPNMNLVSHFDSLVLTDDQCSKSQRISDRLVTSNINEKYLTIEETLKSENTSVNANVEKWKSELMNKVETEIKQQTLNYVDRFHDVTMSRPPVIQERMLQNTDGLEGEDDELNIINSLNKSIQLDPSQIRNDSKPKLKSSRDEQHVIFLLENKIKQFERELTLVKSELRNKSSAYEELMNKLETSETERRKIITESRNLKDTNKKLETHIHELKTKLSSQATEQDKLVKSVAHLNKNNKHIDTSNKNKDVLINKLNEEKKNMSMEMNRLSKMNQDMQAKQEKQMGQLEITLRKLERQKNELYIGFKKQMDYINILKQQRIIQSSKAIHELQKQDYYAMLENPQKVIIDLKVEGALSLAEKRNGSGTSSLISGRKSKTSVYKFEDLNV